MKVHVGVTDQGWYEFLAARHADEVNFWSPSGRGFAAIAPGDPFLFKSRFPEHRIVGGGVFVGSVPLPISAAWEYFGEANGVASLADLRASIARNLHRPLQADEHPVIGCRMLRDVSFWPSEQVQPAPKDWARNLVTGRTYALGRRLVQVRLGQGSFRAAVDVAYGGRCVVTGNHVRPVLQAAHIRPVEKDGVHRVDNGLLLRADVHLMFDRGYLGVHPERRTLEVSPRLRSEFGNGDEFSARAGLPIGAPGRDRDAPGVDFLTWHRDELFRT